ncbi:MULTISPECIES: hypothetical protein [Clostridium]|uniref:Uncharacterized protein n=1 Tax=Clostridium senegalense TaxID=1465809 RepID=A0A6M0H645_9CLOT|nr:MULTISPECIES: hypothetical protein [Clostridium]NEU06007.1 hypothetical protein [Clostridium senegalense]
MAIVTMILEIILFSIISLIAYSALRVYVFSKLKINKWVVLILALAIFLIPNFLWPTMPIVVNKYIIPTIFVILFLWFMDLCGFLKGFDNVKTDNDSGYKKYNKSNNNVIKPKAKPNRVKNKK